MAKWTEKDIAEQNNKTVIITGSNSGIGFQAAKVFALKGAKVVMASRNNQKSFRAIRKILRKYDKANLEYIHLDLASLDSIKKFVSEFRKKNDRLDVLINNAGVMATPHRKTRDGFEYQFGINHLGHFALTGHLIDLLMKTTGSRVVTVTSIAHFRGRMYFDDMEGDSWYSRMKGYRQSKLANLLFAYELQKRLRKSGSGTISVAAHPGISSTNIIWLPFPIAQLKSLVLMRASKGALSVLMAAADDKVRGGEYIGPGGLWQSFGYPAILKSSLQSYDKTLWERLWQVSEEMTGVKYLDNIE
ncbi:MAG: SDR family NAD(P)-dependent oxidoreductase [Bacteroidales bacterium]|nr:SDR family NAD(P)-dependent oxidoreductase [Bacteroidales bacterium]